jgi:hypothetical protein
MRMNPFNYLGSDMAVRVLSHEHAEVMQQGKGKSRSPLCRKVAGSTSGNTGMHFIGPASNAGQITGNDL